MRRGQSFKESSLNSNQNVPIMDESMQDELQGEITESIGGLYEIPEPPEKMTIRKKQVCVVSICFIFPLLSNTLLNF